VASHLVARPVARGAWRRAHRHRLLGPAGAAQPPAQLRSGGNNNNRLRTARAPAELSLSFSRARRTRWFGARSTTTNAERDALRSPATDDRRPIARTDRRRMLEAMIGEASGPGLAVMMMLAVAAAAVVQQVSRTRPVLAVAVTCSPVAGPAVHTGAFVSARTTHWRRAVHFHLHCAPVYIRRCENLLLPKLFSLEILVLT